MTISELEQVVKNTLSEKRYYHSICVMKKCVEFAEIYGVDKELAKIIGLAHDIAKEMTDEEKLKYAKENKLPVNDVEQKHVGLLHAKIGADIAKKQFGFTEEMCKAIRLHTTGGQDMDLFDKILFVADATGEDRKWKDVPFVNDMAKTNIDEAVLYLLDMEIKDRVDNKKLIHIDSVLARNSLINN